MMRARSFVLALLLLLLLAGLGTSASSALAAFGFQSFDMSATNQDGSTDTQAGSHPFQLTTSFTLKATVNGLGATVPDGDIKDLRVDLPAGLVGSATAVPQCSQELLTTIELHNGFNTASCSDASQVGIVGLVLSSLSEPTFLPVYNMTPPPGTPAAFGFAFYGVPINLLPSIRTGSDYGLGVESSNTSQALLVHASTVTIWGVPADPRHDGVRGPCLNEITGGSTGQTCPTGVSPEPLLTLPTSCSGPLTTTARADSWQEPIANLEQWASDTSVSHNGFGEPVGLDACNQLDFNPRITVSPDTSRADTPAGLTVDVKPSLGGLLNANGLSSADIKNTTVTLPAGVVINPGQAAGLQACQSAQENIGSEQAPACPLASKVGTDEIQTPLLKDPLVGDVYVLQSNPPALQLLVAASADGVNVKLVGDVHLDEATGQGTTTFKETPQLPFSDFKLSFSGGAQAALVTPAACGTYTTNADFTPWSTPFQADALTSDTFNVDSGPGGAPCPSAPAPFSPVLTAGSTSDKAGAFTDFSLLLRRPDGQQRISTLQFKTPEGLLGMISSVPLCGEPQASLGTCPAASQIGHTVTEAGPGPYPLVVPQPGAPAAPIYLTGSYKGAPYGLSIVVPVIAGPFNLGTVVVRSAITVDPRTAQLTVTTDALPSILDGIPTDLRTINAIIDRSGFIFNPTNCNETAFTGIANSTEGASTPLSYRFQVGSCRSLEFHPKFSVSTSGRTSKASGSSLTARVVYPQAPQGTQANITKVKVDLPVQLPSRLTTLQKACLSKVFEANPAGCPSQSIVGNARVITPLLPVPLTGPAYFVSHGGEAFPSLTIVLQGYGVTVDLEGTTFISKAGITSTTFNAVPDVPFNTFELALPQGKFSALGANLPAKAKGSFCGQNLKMPTLFVAQNGLEIHESTPVTVTGCPPTRPKVKTRAQKLAAALKACKKKAKGKRASCARRARKSYGAINKKRRNAAGTARTFSLNDSGRLHLTSHHGFTLNEQGSASGTISGTIYIHLHVVSTNHVTAEVNIYPSGGSLTGYASASYRPSGGVATFNGTMIIARGTGRYSHARGSGLSFTGTIQRSNDAVTVRVNGRMSA
jgi:hypothetical protein